jgi:hypothetical protein
VNLRQADFKRLALKSAQARRAKERRQQDAET